MLLSTTSRRVLTLVAVCTIGTGSALARAPTPEFTTVRGWSAEPTQLTQVRGLEGVKLPCVLSNEYDNGYQVRFSGGNNELLAMAIDFRQNVFEQGRQYDAMLSIGDGYVKQVKATAFAPNTLIFNLRPLKGFYGILKPAKKMELAIADNTFLFSLAQIGAAFPSLESCYAGEAQTTIATVQQQDAQQMPPAVDVAPTPTSFDDIIKASPDGANVAQNAAAKPMNIAQVTPRRPDAVQARESRISQATEGASSWEARAGEEIQTVLSRWAQKAGYDLEWQAGQGGALAQDISMDGSFEEAVRQLLAENAASSGLNSRFDNASVPGASAVRTQWNAPAGANIQTVLNQWGQSAGVNVVWQSYASIPVKNSIAMNGSFESAVQALLDQYEQNPERPVGQLNTDPITGTRTLLIDIDRS